MSNFIPFISEDSSPSYQQVTLIRDKPIHFLLIGIKHNAVYFQVHVQRMQTAFHADQQNLDCRENNV